MFLIKDLKELAYKEGFELERLRNKSRTDIRP